MKTNKGFAPLILIIAIVIICAGISFYIRKGMPATQSSSTSEKLLNDHFSLSDGKVFYYEIDKDSSPKVIEQADPTTFQAIDDYYSKDKNHVFARWFVLDNADPATFKKMNLDAKSAYTLPPRLYQDSNHVYCWGETLTLNPTTFKLLGDSFGTDGKNVYDLVYGCQVLKDVDPNTFVQLSPSGTDELFKDKSKVYAHFEGVEISEINPLIADAKSFEIVNYSLGLYKDKDYVYERGLTQLEIIKDVSPLGFKYLGSFYAKNNKKVYRLVYHGCEKDHCSYTEVREVPNADASSFMLVGADKNNPKSETFWTDFQAGTSTIIDAKDNNYSYSNGRVNK